MMEILLFMDLFPHSKEIITTEEILESRTGSSQLWKWFNLSLSDS